MLSRIGIFSLFCLMLFSIVFLFVRTDLKSESREICNWINNESYSDVNFRVGPHAFDHLTKLRGSHEFYTCSIEASPEKHPFEGDVTILVSSENEKQIYLFYMPDFYIMRYFKHWTGNKVRHHE